MDYAGKPDATFSADSQVPASRSDVHDSTPSHPPAGAIVVPDAHFLFNADFKRSGADLILSKDDHELVLHDYFKGERRDALASPDGAHLTGDIVTALTGGVQYAAAGSPATGGEVIGHVTKLIGSATVIRNGVSVILNMGDNVEKGDVVQAGSDSTVGITFIDGTVFGLSSNARMVLNEMVYDPNGSNNSTLFSLVAGTITFVAGETAKHGDMKIDTPVATMGIRGTAVLVEIDFNVPSGSTPDCKFQVLVEPDGHIGSYVLLDKTTLQPLAVVNHAGQQIDISNGIVSETAAPLSPDVQKLIDDVFTLKFGQINPKTTVTFNDTINPELTGSPLKLASGTTATPVYQVASNSHSSSPSFQNQIGLGFFPLHVDRAPTGVVTDLIGQPTTSFSPTELAGTTDTVSGNVNFADVNADDRPTVRLTFSSFAVQNARHQDITSTLSAQQLAEIAAVEVNIVVTPHPGNTNVGSVTWTYSIADNALNLLGAGDTLTLSYLVQVDNNYAPFDQSTTVPITITIAGSLASETWVAASRGGGLWSDAANWDTGRAPPASDDVIIVTDASMGLTPTYPVTIDAPAFAKSVTMNDLSATPPELDNDSTLTIGGPLTLSADSILHNFGTISVGGAAEITQQSTLANSGTLVLGHGGDFNGESGITNTAYGTIEVSGGALNVLVDVNNQGQITVDAGATLALATGAIDGGTVTIQGMLDLAGSAVLDQGALDNTNQINVTGSGNALDAETVTNRGAIEILDGGALTIDRGSTVANADGSVIIDAGGTLTLNDASITGGVLTNDGTLNVAATSALGITGNITGTGSIDIFNQAEVEIGGSVSSLQTVTFEAANGQGLLVLDDSHGFHGTISGLTEFPSESLENHVDLRDLTYTAGDMIARFSGGVLTIGNGIGDQIALHLSGSSDAAFELAPDGSGGTLIDDPLASSGTVTIDSGNTLDVAGASTATVNFANSGGNTGELVLQDSKDFAGLIAGFAGDGTPGNSDKLDLQDVNFSHLATETYVGNAAGTGGTLTVSDGTNTARIDFAGTYVLDNFKFLSDGNGGTLLLDPPVDSAHQFIFAPTTGQIPTQSTIDDFNANPDTIGLQQFTNIDATADALATATLHGSDTLLTPDSPHTILLENALLSSLHASNFVVTPHV